MDERRPPPNSKLRGGGVNSIPTRRGRAGYTTYAEYLKSPHWRETRKRYWREHLKVLCACCDHYRASELHHRSYARLGHERLTDFVPLCRDCHQEVHDYLTTRKHSKQGEALWKAHEVVRKRHTAALRRQEKVSAMAPWQRALEQLR